MGRKKIIETSLIPIDDSTSELFDIESKKTTKRQIGYVPSFFTTASLPFKNVNKTTFVRKGSNGLTLTLTSPKNVPYGKYGRLLLSILTTHAVIQKNSELPVMIEYTSMADLLKELQLPKQRGKDIREQLDCFSGASFIFEQKVEELKAGYLFKDLYKEGDYPKGDVAVRTVTTGSIRFTTGVQFKEVTDLELNGSRVGYFKIVLSDEFASFCQRHAVPIDYEVYKDIASPIGKDLYAWLVYRNNSIKEPVFIPRSKLVDQFMPLDKDSGTNGLNKHYYHIIEELKEIKEKYYPELNLDINKDGSGITLRKSPTPVIENDPRYALITTDI